KEATAKAKKELRKLKMMSPMSAEATVVRNYIDWILGLRWYEYTKDKLDINEAEKILNDDHYGVKKPKERILEYLAVQATVDKMSTDFRGDPSAALLEVLDPEQNHAFGDHYLDLDYDLSKVLFICTANTLHGIPPPLQDRLEIIRIAGYTDLEKLSIAQRYLVPKQKEQNGLEKVNVTFSRKALLELAHRYTKESGVRGMEREVATLCRKVAKDVLRNGGMDEKIRITTKKVHKLLGPPKFRYGRTEERDEIGLVTGLAWTEVGGELLQTEATVIPGKGKLILTGKLGDVMQESAQAAL